MIPNNNLSILPFYSSLDEQNARKWWVYGRVYPLYCPVGTMPPFQIMRESSMHMLEMLSIYTVDGVLIRRYTYEDSEMAQNIFVENFSGYDVIVGNFLFATLPLGEGQYYAVLKDAGQQEWYSDVWTCVQDMSPFLKLEWWDTSDFVMDAGRIVYKYAGGTQFRNRLYLQAEIAKPDYVFEEEGETRDGYFFPTKQISEKRYRFAFFAPEYLLDVMRFVRMSDFVEITEGGKRYSVDSFLITPDWEDNGDITAVQAEFDTATVAKKIGNGYIKAQRGDFNDDFNNDFNNQNNG